MRPHRRCRVQTKKPRGKARERKGYVALPVKGMMMSSVVWQTRPRGPPWSAIRGSRAHAKSNASSAAAGGSSAVGEGSSSLCCCFRICRSWRSSGGTEGCSVVSCSGGTYLIYTTVHLHLRTHTTPPDLQECMMLRIADDGQLYAAYSTQVLDDGVW